MANPLGGQSSMSEALCASGPNEQHLDKLMQFGRLVGAWDLEGNFYDLSGRVSRRTAGEWHFGWALEGRAIQDVWIVPPRKNRSSPSAAGEYGTTLRFYDPTIDAWRSTWHGPVNGIVWQFTGRQQGTDMVLERTQEDGSLMRWIFADIREKSFRWRAVAASDVAGSWRLEQEMFARRRQ